MVGSLLNSPSFSSSTPRLQEELSKNWLSVSSFYIYTETKPVLISSTVFEDKELADKAVIAVEKQIHHEDMVGEEKQTVVHSEGIVPEKDN